ncbi:MAG: hypothetical protein ACRD3G_09535 [Vicinamibacterales bacterium]
MPDPVGVCLQTMWRSCGTYLFSRFRQHDAFHGYWEPCHEQLADLRPGAAAAGVDRDAQALLRHQELTDSYLKEFPVRPEGGVPFYQKRFAYDDYDLPGHAVDPAFQHYVAFLLSNARQHGKIPVLKPCRWSMRSAWLAAHFGVRCVYVLRDPDAVFRSYWSFNGRRSYFLMAALLIVAKNRRSELFAELASAASIPAIEGKTTREELGTAYRLVEHATANTLRDIVLLLWALNLHHNVGAGAVVADVDVMVGQPDHRAAVEARIEQATGHRVALDGLRQTMTSAAPGLIVSPRGAAIARAALSRLPRCEWTGVTVSPACERVLSALV